MNKETKSIFLWGLGILIPVGIIVWVVSLPKISQDEFISQNGLHYHSELHIKINGEEVDIPANIGIAATHNPIHTHETDHVIHMEFSGTVKKDDLKLARFFEIWGRDFSKDSILGSKTGEGGIVKMLVNGAENAEFENYMMKDGDKIEIIYEQTGPPSGENDNSTSTPQTKK